MAVSTGDDLSAIQGVPVAGGPAVTISANIRALRAFDISPDERRIAYSIDRPTTDVWLLDLKAALTYRHSKLAQYDRGSPEGYQSPGSLGPSRLEAS